MITKVKSKSIKKQHKNKKKTTLKNLNGGVSIFSKFKKDIKRETIKLHNSHVKSNVKSKLLDFLEIVLHTPNEKDNTLYCNVSYFDIKLICLFILRYELYDKEFIYNYINNLQIYNFDYIVSLKKRNGPTNNILPLNDKKKDLQQNLEKILKNIFTLETIKIIIKRYENEIKFKTQTETETETETNTNKNNKKTNNKRKILKNAIHKSMTYDEYESLDKYIDNKKTLSESNNRVQLLKFNILLEFLNINKSVVDIDIQLNDFKKHYKHIFTVNGIRNEEVISEEDITKLFNDK